MSNEMTADEARATIEAGEALKKNTVITTPIEWGGFDGLVTLPDGFKCCHWCDISNCQNITSLPAKMVVADGLDLSGNSQINSLPDDLQVGGWLRVDDCGSVSVPKGVDIAGTVINKRKRYTSEEFKTPS